MAIGFNAHSPVPPVANGHAPHANGTNDASASAKRGHVFNPSGNWSDRIVADDNVYSKRRIDCSEGRVMDAVPAVIGTIYGYAQSYFWVVPF